jgi:NDP-sugar pyrophosphorylase family protein
VDLTAILLCGGKGERLRPLTETIPKPLVPLRGRPLLHHLMDYLIGAGVRRFVLCVGYKAGMIEQFLREHYAGPCDARCVDSGDATMTDRLLDARRLVPGRALVCYGDTLANVSLPALVGEHEAHAALATVTVHPLHCPFGVVDFDPAGRVGGFREKPRLPHWVNIGFLLMEPAALEMLPPGGDMPEYLSALAATGRMFAHRHEGKHLTVNTERERDQAEREIATFYTLPQREDEE